MKSRLLVLSVLYFNAAYSQVSSESSHLKIQFLPTTFYNIYNATAAPALRIKAGDTVSTESLDALGFDKDSVKRGERGNPLTGPFYIEGATAGDVLAITITQLSLNRNSATTLNAFIPKILPNPQGKKLWKNARLARWALDTINNIAFPVKNYDHLTSIKLPMHPFLGSVGVAPPGTSGISSGGFGTWGGNLDFFALTSSATLYLPVFHDGAFLYFGDGHAAQGDGELNGDALETSMRFTFTVNIIKNAATQLKYPRLENPNYIMAFGQGSSTDRALKEATLNLINWLQNDYALSIEEASQLIGPAVEFRIPKIASNTAEVVAMIRKTLLPEAGKTK